MYKRQLFYHGINIKDLVSGFIREKRFGFEEAVYLLLFGQLPSERQLKDFSCLLYTSRSPRRRRCAT